MLRKLVCIAAMALVWLVLFGNAQAKYKGFADEVFFGRHTGAAGAAMGKVGVTSSGDIISTFYNPAGLADARGVGFYVSSSEPCYLLEDAEYRYVGGSVGIKDYGALGVSKYNLDYGKDYSTDASIFMVTLASEPRKNLLVGLNISAFQYRSSMGMGGRSDVDAQAFWADVGVIKYYTLGRTDASGHWLRLGGSLSNFTFSDIHVAGTYDDLPAALRLGAAYEMGWWGVTWKGRLRTVETIVQAEYQDILNYDHRTALRLGGEIRLIEVLAFRLGYYRETVDDHGYDSNRDSIEDTTYGFGFHLPLHKISAGKLPLKLGLDYAKMEQPSYTRRGDTDDFTTLSVYGGYHF
jgi:hypothetical protein